MFSEMIIAYLLRDKSVNLFNNYWYKN